MTHKSTLTLKFLFAALLFVCCAQVKAEVTYSNVLIAEEYSVGHMLAWATDYEENSRFFFVERSDDGINFNSIGQIDAAGYSDADKKYHFLDVGVKGDKTYYRLKQTDTDGTSSYTDVISLNKTLVNEFMVVRLNTTEVTDDFICTIDNLTDGTMRYEICDLRGQVKEGKEFAVQPGINHLNVDFSELPPGLYKVNLMLNEESESLIIQRTEDAMSPALRASKTPIGKGG